MAGRAQRVGGGGVLKKDTDYTALSHVKWAAWGVIDIDDSSKMNPAQRRNYIARVREELKLHALKLECGGSKVVPFYRVFSRVSDGAAAGAPRTATSAARRQPNAHAFSNVMLAALLRIQPNALVEHEQEAAL